MIDDPFASIAETSQDDPFAAISEKTDPPPLPKKSALSRFVSSGVAPFVETAKGLVPHSLKELGTRMIPGVAQYDVLKRMVVEPGVEQAKKTAEEFKQANPWSLHPTAEQVEHRQKAAGHGLATILPVVGPWAANVAEKVGEQIGTGDTAGGVGTLAGNAALYAAPHAAKLGKILPKSGKYAPTSVELAGEKVPVLVGEANPESAAGRSQTGLKRSGYGAPKFTKVENAQQEAVKQVIRNTAQQTSEMVGPTQGEPGPAMQDAANATFGKARPMYAALDASLKTVPDALQSVSKVTQDAIAKARKLGVQFEGPSDISKIVPDKDGAIQWGGSKISKATHPERWQKLLDEGIIDDSGHGTPLTAYMKVRSQLLKMQRSASDPALRHAIGNDIETMTRNMEDALKGTPLFENWTEASRLWAKGYALRDVADAIKDSTKGTPASAQAPGIKAVPTRISGSTLVDKLNELSDNGTLKRAFTPEEASNLRQSADILDRIQKTPIGKGFGESMSRSRGLAHAVSGAKGPLIGAGVGAVTGLLTHGSPIIGAEAGAGIGFIVQAIGERALVRIMTKTEGVKALKTFADAKTPEEMNAARRTIVALAGQSQPKKRVAAALTLP